MSHFSWHDWFPRCNSTFQWYFSYFNLGFTGCTVIGALNAVHEEPVVEDGKVVVGKVANINFSVDHRYIDGGKCKNLISTFLNVFENPESYL